ncbi:hypothetical protein [Pseudonocardia phyllosphaerae]|uniref:hypothetical protein n=1 Tax=Pseudonocardia phyllosphaerae TaxID=3390502 RepID=UPI00397BC07A
MNGVRRRTLRRPAVRTGPSACLAALVLAGALTGCGDSLATRPSSTPHASPTTSRSQTPFCEALQRSREAARPVNELGVSRQKSDTGEVVTDVRSANQQVLLLAPQEIRPDVQRANEVVELQLRVLERTEGDTLALSRDPDVSRERSDPQNVEASQRIQDYSRRMCTT